jgi:hypothetical protein
MNASLLCFGNPVQIRFMALEIACDGIGKDLEGGFGMETTSLPKYRSTQESEQK